MRRHLAIAAIAIIPLLAVVPASYATPKVTLKARFSPNQLAQDATLFYEISISEPIPVQSIELRLPRGASLAGSSLGLAECQPQLLQEEGPQACPANSIMGLGTAIGGIRLDSKPPILITASAKVVLALGPQTNEDANPTILILVETITPTSGSMLLDSHLAPSPAPYSYALNVQVPLDQMWPEGPYAALLNLKATIGPQGVTYRRTEHGHTITFKPRGLTTPARCPPRGFPFQARVHFYNDTTTTTIDRARCPDQSRPRR